MSGHSKWATIKRDKEINDSKKGAIFTKISRDISQAAKNGGGDPSLNAGLAAAMSKAKAANMSNDKVQKAIEKGLGITKSGVTLSEVSYEAYGPGDIGMIIDASTDNRNRTLSELKTMIEKSGGRVVEMGAVSWNFETKGEIILLYESEEEKQKRENIKWGNNNLNFKLPIDNKEFLDNFELTLFDCDGVTDIQFKDNGLYIYTLPEELGNIKKIIEDLHIEIESADLVKISKEKLTVSDELKEKNYSLLEKIEDHDDVQKVWLGMEA